VPVVEVEVWDWFAGVDINDLKLNVKWNTLLVLGDVFADVLSGDIYISWLVQERNEHVNTYSMALE
jgi:hypothetical protein